MEKTYKKITINPGTDLVKDPKEGYATQNVSHLIADIGLPGILASRLPESDYKGGWFAYELALGDSTTELQMPGSPLEEIRYAQDEKAISNFRRMYVDDSSWHWEFAVNVARDRLLGDE